MKNQGQSKDRYLAKDCHQNLIRLHEICLQIALNFEQMQQNHILLETNIESNQTNSINYQYS